ncbi:MAG: hypothetical protein M3083_09060 [Actinomycetota bacterium]|nr:hypothetical protein [Actinomycetota bacterium]
MTSMVNRVTTSAAQAAYGALSSGRGVVVVVLVIMVLGEHALLSAADDGRGSAHGRLFAIVSAVLLVSFALVIGLRIAQVTARS